MRDPRETGNKWGEISECPQLMPWECAGHNTDGKPKQSPTKSLSWGERTERVERTRRIEAIKWSTREERATHRENSKSAEGLP